MIKEANHGAFGYNKIPERFYDAIVSWYDKRYNSKIKKEWIIPSCGVILEIRILLDVLTKENENVILQTPVYHTFHKVINVMKRNIIENKLIKKDDTYEIDYNNLEELFAAGNKVLILCSPHNPVGRIWSKEEIQNVINLAKKYGAFVIIDEIHSDLQIFDKEFTSGADFINCYENIAICNAPSKTFNIAGLCTSYIIIPDSKLKEKFENQVARECLNEPTVFGYSSLIAAYENGEKWVDSQNEYLRRNYEYLKSYLNENLPQLKVTKLEATYLVWLDFSYTNLNSEELVNKCNEGGITCNAGVLFGKDYESFLRFNIACPFDQMKEGLERLVKTFK